MGHRSRERARLGISNTHRRLGWGLALLSESEERATRLGDFDGASLPPRLLRESRDPISHRNLGRYAATGPRVGSSSAGAGRSPSLHPSTLVQVPFLLQGPFLLHGPFDAHWGRGGRGRSRPLYGGRGRGLLGGGGGRGGGLLTVVHGPVQDH